MRIVVLLICSAFLLTGCVSKEERARRYAQYQIAECVELGVKPDTDAMVQCRLQVQAIDAANAAAGAASHAANAQWLRTLQSRQAPPAARTWLPRTVTCFRQGHFVTCH